MQERITVMGRVAAEPQRGAKDGGPAGPVTFRFAVNNSRWDEAQRSFVDVGTNWYTVKAWRALGDNVLESVSKGQPLLVHGRLELTSWTDSSGRERITPTIHAEALGHDLRRGIGVFTARAAESSGAPEQFATAPAAGGQQDRWADPADPGDLPF